MLNRIILGTWPLSGDFVDYSSTYIRDLLLRSIDLGFTRFDTAPNYGSGAAESFLSLLPSNSEHHLEISTKLGNSPLGKKSFLYQDVLNNFHSSCERLGSVPDRVLLHNPRISDDDIVALRDKFHDDFPDLLVGISLPRSFDTSFSTLSTFSYTQFDLNLFYPFDPRFNSLGIRKEVRSIFASGLLTDKFYSRLVTNPSFQFPETDLRSSWFGGSRASFVYYQLTLLAAVRDYIMPDSTLEEIAFRYVLSFSDLDLVVGITSASHLDSIISWLKLGSLPPEFFTLLSKFSSSSLQGW